jgi:coenzyme F420 hydrogenase subunit beta
LITSLKWRAGEWPGYLEIKTASGRVVQTPKVYYNFLIPFFVTQTSLQSMDFSNEFADLAVGDAWSPVFESQGGGHSIVVTRTPEMEAIIAGMQATGLLELTEEDPGKASDMHGHMLDFKKRGGWLRNQWRRKTGRPAPNYGYCPAYVPASRILVEVVVSGLFAVGKTRIAHWIVSMIPEFIIGPVFNHLRLGWKKASRPTKRKGLANFEVKIFS